MKRLLPFLPFVFIVFINACGGLTQTPIPPDVGTAVALTQTASMWTAVPTSTYNPNIASMINTLNADLSNFNPLEHTLDAEYHVIDVSFPYVPEAQTFVFRVDVRCACVNGAKCCHPERMFVVVVDSMKRNFNTILMYVPSGVGQVLVVCSSQAANIGAMSASWQDVRGYLVNQISGHQLGVRVTRTTVP